MDDEAMRIRRPSPAPENAGTRSRIGRATGDIARRIGRVGPGGLLAVGAIGVAREGDAAVPWGCSATSALALFAVSAILHWDFLDQLATADDGRSACPPRAALAGGLSFVTASLAATLLARSL